MNTSLLRSSSWAMAGSLLLAMPSALLAETQFSSNWFVEAGLANVDASRTVSGFTIDGDKTGWLFGVGYALNRNFSLKANYHDLGDRHFATDCPPPNLCIVENLERVDLDGFSFSAIGSVPLTAMLDVYGKVGILTWDAKFQGSAQDKSGEDVLYGAGLGVNFWRNWRLNLEYERSSFDLDSTSIGFAYRF